VRGAGEDPESALFMTVILFAFYSPSRATLLSRSTQLRVVFVQVIEGTRVLSALGKPVL
jgi:hypothetical protein